MSIDKSLRLRNSLSRQRNVMTRAQRVQQLIRDGKFDIETGDPIGLPKVRVVRVRKAVKKKEKADDSKK